MRFYGLVLFLGILIFAGCSQPPAKMSHGSFAVLLQHGQVDKVVIVNGKTAEFTIKNSKEYPMGKWYGLPPINDAESFANFIEGEQKNVPQENKALVSSETRVKFLRETFNYLLPAIVFAGLVAGFFVLRRNRN